MDSFNVWKRLWGEPAAGKAAAERRRKAQYKADVQSCIDACKKAAQERRIADTLNSAVDRLMAILDTPIPGAQVRFEVAKPNRITMEATAHPLPDVPTQAEMDAAITWLIYLTNHEHGPTVRYGTVEL